MQEYWEVLKNRLMQIEGLIKIAKENLAKQQKDLQDLEHEYNYIIGIRELHLEQSEQVLETLTPDKMITVHDSANQIKIAQHQEQLGKPQKYLLLNKTLQNSDNNFESAIVDILTENGEPLHVVQIEKALRQRNVVIPGKGYIANIITRMRRSPLFIRVSSGTYALASSGANPMRSTRRVKQPRKRNRLGISK